MDNITLTINFATGKISINNVELRTITIEDVSKNGLLLNCIPMEFRTDEMCIKAIAQNPEALQFVPNDKKKLFEKIICYNKKKITDWRELQYIENQTEEMCLEAVKQNGYALEYVENQTEEICFEAVKQNGRALQFVKNQTENICSGSS